MSEKIRNYITWTMLIILLAFIQVALLPDPLAALKLSLIILTLMYVNISFSTIHKNYLIALTSFAYLTAFFLDLRVEGRLSPLLTDPNYEALFFMMLLGCKCDRINLFLIGVILSIFSGSYTCLIAAFLVLVAKSIYKYIGFLVVVYPLILLLLINTEVAEELINLSNSTAMLTASEFGVDGFKIISFQNRLVSQLQHLDMMGTFGLIGYGRASLVGLQLGAHNTLVQVLAQQGLILYVPIVYLLYRATQKLSKERLVILMTFSFTLDVFAFVLVTLTLWIKDEQSFISMPNFRK